MALTALAIVLSAGAFALSTKALDADAAAATNPSPVARHVAVDAQLHTGTPVLLAWASELSGYPVPEVEPAIVYRPHEFFVDRVCGGRECPAVGWYDDRDVIYLDDRYRRRDQDDFANSLLVHELVHFLQHHSERFDSRSCRDSLLREREAYAVQNEYLVSVRYSIRFIAPQPVSCAY